MFGVISAVALHEKEHAMKILFISLLLIAVLVATAACSAKSVSTQSVGYETKPGSYPAPTTTMATIAATKTPSPAFSTPNDASLGGNPSAATTDRMIIRTGSMSIIIEDVQTAIDYITNLANTLDGFVVSSNTWQVSNSLRGTISIRIPAGSYNNVIRIIRDMAVEVNSENTSAADFTEQYTDLQAQLTTLKATEQQLLAIMAKAVTVEETLQVQSQLTSIQTQIASLEGSIKYIENNAAMSLLTIDLQQSKLAIEITTSGSVVKAREPVYFYANISGGFTPYSYQWDFGDGTTSTNASPSHSYKNPGDYTIKLTVTDDRGNTSTETRENYVNVLTGWSAGNTAGNAWNGLAVFGQVLVNILIWVGYFSIVWIPAGVIIFLVVRRNKKRRAAQAGKQSNSK
jgi:hypothetical protein